MKKIWEKLFSKENEKTEIELHVAGATVRHKNPFENLEIPRNPDELTDEFVEKWVMPFYMSGFSDLTLKQESDFTAVFSKIDSETISLLLGDFNWRTRIVGAYFSALKNFTEFEEIIGNHLLKSEVCYAGGGYCLALASFGTEKSKKFLKQYLDYYLTRKDLWFDQSEALAALSWLDESEAEKYEPLWTDFISDKSNWNLDKSKEHFAKSMQNLQKIRSAAIKK